MDNCCDCYRFFKFNIQTKIFLSLICNSSDYCIPVLWMAKSRATPTVSFSLPHRFCSVTVQLCTTTHYLTMFSFVTVPNFVKMSAPKFSLNERILLIKLWYKNEGSFKNVIDEFAVKSPGSSAPNRSTIWKLVKRFEEFGTVDDKLRSG